MNNQQYKELLQQDIDLLQQQLDLIQRRAEQLRQTLAELRSAVQATDEAEVLPPAPETEQPACQPVEDETDGGIEVELIYAADDEEEFAAEEELLPDEQEDDALDDADNEQEADVEEEEQEDALEQDAAEAVVEPKKPTKATAASSLEQSLHIDDIRKGLSLGDRFLFQRELFAGNGEKMNKTLDKLNGMADMDEAMEYIGKKFDWDTDSPAYQLFVNLLKRRF